MVMNSWWHVTILLWDESIHRHVRHQPHQAAEIEAGRMGHTPLKLASMIHQLGKSTQEQLLGELVTGQSAIRSELAALASAIQRPRTQTQYSGLLDFLSGGSGRIVDQYPPVDSPPLARLASLAGQQEPKKEK